MKFLRKRKKRPKTILEIKDKCGILVQSSNHGCVWIIAPFWDVTDPVLINAPDVNVDAIIVINNHVDGCLPLSSFLAADADLPLNKIYVTNPENPHDWHPKYKAAVNELSKSILLPEILKVGDIEVYYNTLNDFVEIDLVDPIGRQRITFSIGLNLHDPNEKEELDDDFETISLPYTHYFVGNFDLDNFKNTVPYMTNHLITFGPERLRIFQFKDWIKGDTDYISDACNAMGIDVYSVGETETEN